MPVKLIKQYLCISILVLLSPLSSVYAQNSDDKEEEEPRANGLAILESKKNETSLNKLERVLVKHFRAILNDPIESFIITGTYKTQGTELDLKIYAKRPWLLKQRIRKNNINYVGVYDSQKYWYEGPSTEEDPMTAINDELLQIECHQAALLWGFEMKGTRGLKLANEAPANGRPCYVILNTQVLGTPITHYIDVETGIELQRKATLKTESDTYEILLTYDKRASFDSKQAAWPEGYKLYINDKLYSHAQFKSVRFNAGVMPWTFSKPKGE